METIAKIRAEIERLENYYTSVEWYVEALHSFLDTLESERPEPYNPVYDEAYLNEKIKKATESWKGVDVDAMLAECRGYDEEKSKKPMNQDGLEEELDRFIASGKSVTVDDYGTYKVSYHDFKKIARHFAEWQKEQDDRLADIIYQQGIEKGKDEMKEQMLKEARNHFVLRVLSDNATKKMIELYNDEVDCKFGDVVRIIIIKENGK